MARRSLDFALQSKVGTSDWQLLRKLTGFRRLHNLAGGGERGTQRLIGQAVSGLDPHRVSNADGITIEVMPVIVEAGAVLTSPGLWLRSKAATAPLTAVAAAFW